MHGDDVLNADAGPLVDWATLDQDRFERLVEALVAYQHPEGSQIDAIDGRGGDGGVDVAAVEPDATGKVVIWQEKHGRLVVYQLKYYREGFSGPVRGRREHIKKSLKQALKTNPTMAEWVLVAPCRLTTGDRTFLEKLREAHPDLVITFVGRADLDGESWVAGHMDVARAIVTRSELLGKAKILGRETEKAVLADGLSDVMDRQLNLNRVTDDLDPHWTLRVVDVPGGVPTVFVHAKHPAAPEISPISVGFDIDRFSPEGAAFVKKQEYGLMEPARLPAGAVRNFTVTGPEFVVSHLNQGELAGLEVHPDVDREPASLTLSFLDAAGHTLKSVRGQVRKAAVGPRGATVRQEFFDGAVVIDWRIPTNSSLDGGADVTQDLSGTHGPEHVRDALALVLALHEMPQNMKLTTADGSQLARLGFDQASRPQVSPTQHTERKKLRELADDLAALQGLCDRQFEFPESVSALDRIDARIFRRLLEGRVVCDREAQVLHLNIRPEALDDPGFQQLINGGGSQLMFDREPFQWTIDAVKGQGDAAEVFLSEPLGFYFPELVADNADEVIVALRRGENARLDLRSPSRLRPRLFLRNRLSPQQRVVPEPWRLLEIPEVPELQGWDDDVAS